MSANTMIMPAMTTVKIINEYEMWVIKEIVLAIILLILVRKVIKNKEEYKKNITIKVVIGLLSIIMIIGATMLITRSSNYTRELCVLHDGTKTEYKISSYRIVGAYVWSFFMDWNIPSKEKIESGEYTYYFNDVRYSWIYDDGTTNNKEEFEVDASKVKFLNPDELYSSSEMIKKEGMSDKEVKFNEKSIIAEYKYSRDNIDVYSSKQKDEYMFTNDVLTGFLAYDYSNIKTEKINIESVKDKVKEFLKEYVNNFEKYSYEEESINYEESYYHQPFGVYHFYYPYKINGYETFDYIFISISDTGQILDFGAPRQGMFDQYKDVKFDAEKIENLLLDTVRNKLDNTLLNLEISDRYLKIIDNKLVLYVGISDVSEEHPFYVEEYLYYELE